MPERRRFPRRNGYNAALVAPAAEERKLLRSFCFLSRNDAVGKSVTVWEWLML